MITKQDCETLEFWAAVGASVALGIWTERVSAGLFFFLALLAVEALVRSLKADE